MEGDNVRKVEINVHDGGQANIALGNGTVYSEQNNGNENNDSFRENSIRFQNNMKQYYIENWKSRLFLHKEDGENTLTLKDAYVEPDYKIMHSNQWINFCNEESLRITINKYIEYDRNSTMLITGVPGMGKTTIVSWIAQYYAKNDNLICLRFRDWDYGDLYCGLLKAICNTLKCSKKDLNGKLIVLDGFDEMKSLDQRGHILNEFVNDVKDLEKSKIIITSRPAYIDSSVFQNIIELLPFNVEKIKLFFNKITNKELKQSKIDENNLDVMGIPVILYMAIMSNIDITEKTTKPKLYHRIFAEKGGIFDRFDEYDSGSHITRNPENIKKYLQFLRETAFKMFVKNDLSLLIKECDIPELEFEGKKVSVLDFPIKHLFERAEADIEFIHKSIYECFVSEYIFSSISEIIERDDFGLEDLAGVMGRMFKYSKFSCEILDFLKHKVRDGLSNKSDIISDAFNLMLEDGMTYYTNERYKNIMACEMIVFTNMLEVLHLWTNGFRKVNSSIIRYLQYNKNNVLNLTELSLIGVNLSGLDLSGSDLRRVTFNESDLTGINLSNADLGKANLVGANLTGANLAGANLAGANLRGINLTGANLTDANLIKVRLKGAILTGTILTGVDLTETACD